MPNKCRLNNVGGGYLPTFQWYKNGLLLSGQTASTYTDSFLVNGDTLIIAMHSNAGCPVTQPTFSNHVGVTVSPNLPTAVSIAAAPDSIGGGPVTFTAIPVFGGPNPAYICCHNGSSIPNDTTDTWTAYSLQEGDVVQVRMESRAVCPAPPIVYSRLLGVHNGMVSVTGVSAPPGMRIYTNPASDAVTLELSGRPVGGSITLCDATGRTLLKSPLTGDAHYTGY